MKDEIIMRLKYVEETYAGEAETWVDPVTGTHYLIPISIIRDLDNAKPINQ